MEIKTKLISVGAFAMTLVGEYTPDVVLIDEVPDLLVDTASSIVLGIKPLGKLIGLGFVILLGVSAFRRARA